MKKWKDWKPKTAVGQVLVQLTRRYYLHGVARDSAALTYYLLFAVFPLLILVSSLLGILELDVEEITRFLLRFVPLDVVNTVEAYLNYVSENSSRQLLWFSLVFSLWFPMRATASLLYSMRKAFGRPQPTNVLFAWLRTLFFTGWLLLSLTLSLTAITVGRRLLTFAGRFVVLPDWLTELWEPLRFVLLGVVMWILISLLYRLAMERKGRWREIAPGVAMSLCAWMFLSLAFSYYVERFAHYTELYGSIAAIVVALLWIYMGANVLILGAELSGVLLERREAREQRNGAVKKEENQ